MNLIQQLKKKIYPIYSKYIRRATLTEGILANSDFKIKFLFFGDNGRRPYLDDFAYQSPTKTLVNHSITYSKLQALIETHKPDLALVYLPEKWDYLKNNYRHYKTLHYVSQRIDVSGSWEEVKSQFSRSRRTFSNQVKSKYGYECRISHDPKDFDHFYHNMYLPYITSRFNNEYLDLDTYDEMKAYFGKGFLLFITHQGNDLLASLTVEEGENLTYRRVGIENSDNQHNNSKAQMAMYYYLIKTAREKGFRYMNAMESLAYFNDGVYQSKWRWGASLLKNDRTDVIPYYLILNNTKNTIAFFEQYPAIIHTEKGLFGLLGWHGSVPPSEEEKKSLRKSYYAKGLTGMALMRENSTEAYEYIF